MAMQLNCNGSSWGPRAKRMMREARQGERGKRILNSKFQSLSLPRKEKMWGCSPIVKWEKQGQTLLGSYANISYKKPVLVKSIFWSRFAHNWEPATLSNPTKSWGAKCIPIAYHRFICGYWQFSICQWKNTLHLKLRHTLALSLKRLRERSYTRITHSKR